MSCTRTPLDLTHVRQRLAEARGRDYWRTLEELSQEEGFQELLAREFPRQAGEWTDPVSRRSFLMLMGASLGLAGLSGCSPAPQEKIMPYVQAPEEIVPGRPLYFATAMPLAGSASGLLVQSHMGRPTKVEGNPDHPSNPRPANQPPRARFGPSDQFAQASVLTLYDPDRSQAVINAADGISTWEAFIGALSSELGRLGSHARVRVLTGAVSSPTFVSHITRLLGRYPAARWHVHEPALGQHARLGALYAFHEDVEARYHFDRAEVVLALDADFLGCDPNHLRYVHDFVGRRRIREGQQPRTMNRLYVVESTPTTTGAYADHRLPLLASRVESFIRALAVQLGVPRAEIGGPAPHNIPAAWIAALAEDLSAHHGSSLVLVGDSQLPLVHALAHALNQHLGNAGRTVDYGFRPAGYPVLEGDTVEARVRSLEAASLSALTQAMDRREVDILVILDSNPAYTAPANLGFAELMQRVPFSVHLGLYHDETAQLCQWHIPEAHYLESWQDVRAWDGTASIVQPLIQALYRGRTPAELVALFTTESDRGSYEIVREFWETFLGRDAFFPRLDGRAPVSAEPFETRWRRALHAGMMGGTRMPPRELPLQDWTAAPGGPSLARDFSLEIVFRPDPTIFDGRFANNAWLQELPKPLTKLTWDNVALISPATAVRLGFAPQDRPELANEKVVTLEYKAHRVDAPLWVLPGQPDDCVTVHLGYGRWRAGRVGNNLGFNAYRVRTSTAPWFDTGLTLRPTGRRYPLATTQSHHLMPHGREGLLQHGTLEGYDRLAHPDGPDSHLEGHRPRQTLELFSGHNYDGYKWGMNIDLTACTGCGACVVACQAENNIPVVGKDQVARGREMHWLRIDSYFVGGSDNPQTFFQPVPCMHCENAPCELVCPVAATVHSEDGLNDMVYNRCVGTRYCSNNCPYKVRRFNFLAYSSFAPSSRDLQFNPEVTVRSRGVMEKCTYCIQRIRTAQIDAELENRRVRDGEVMTACQAACPAGAILFGDLNQRSGRSKVADMEAEPLNYGLLAELNTRPRTTYQAALKNPNPAIVRIEHRS
jgi:molybdopterin-containing oxidoreductase family iron-sulfur binding subunit